MNQSISITVKGIVQGVYYRQRTKEFANQNSVTGEIKNLHGGDVHIIASGTEENLQKFIAWCNKGPETAVVSDVNVEKVPYREFEAFKIVK